jgi:putative polyketide hydroxylase
MGSRRPVSSELAIDLAGRIPHQWIASPAGSVSTLDLVGDAATLMTGRSGDAWDHAAARLGGQLPVSNHRLDDVSARALGIADGGALLVRPDGFPVASWPALPDAAAALRDGIAAMIGASSDRAGLARPAA